MKCVVSTWFGTYLVDGETVLRSAPAPLDPDELAERARSRRRGELTPEEEALLEDPVASGSVTSDRRLASGEVRFDARASRTLPRSVPVPERAPLLIALLADAERSLEEAWDPSVHIQEAVRAGADLDRVRNLLGERLGSWVSHDFPDLDPGDHARAAAAATEGSPQRALAPTDPALVEARRELGELYRSVVETRRALQEAVAASAPARTPNLTALLGPELAARLVAQAGGLDRLARLPSSTVQVLGAERAFFEHLRGRAPPPRHGLLFVHPTIQSAPRSERGKLARALAGKVAIAARLDHGGAPLDTTLARAYDARRAQIQARRGRPERKTKTVTPST